MPTETKRLALSVPRNMEAELDAAKRSLYRESTSAAMLRDLIRRGLDSLEGGPAPGKGPAAKEGRGACPS